jgi:NADPH:quinone reductase-like Zn-dependent oxidoreductase
MKAIVYSNYGQADVLQLKEVEKPAPRDNEVLIKVQAAGINAADSHLVKGEPFMARLMFGLFKPKYPILGADIAGQVEAVGGSVTQFQPGDEVFGDLSGSGWGGFAEYVCAPEDVLVLKPAGLSFAAAAAVPMAAVTALQGLRDHGQVKPGQEVLIHGASGGVGTYAVQIARALGARVTAVCSTSKLDLVRSLGAERVIDYTREDFAGGGPCYDVILVANGDRPIGDYRRALRPGGILVVAGGSMKQLLQAMLLGPVLSRSGGQKIGHLVAGPNQKDLARVTQMLETGEIVPVIDKCYPLSEVPDAIRHVGNGHARGKVVVTVR